MVCQLGSLSAARYIVQIARGYTAWGFARWCRAHGTVREHDIQGNFHVLSHKYRGLMRLAAKLQGDRAIQFGRLVGLWRLGAHQNTARLLLAEAVFQAVSAVLARISPDRNGLVYAALLQPSTLTISLLLGGD